VSPRRPSPPLQKRAAVATITGAEIDVEWPDNRLRHSFASYHLMHFKDAKALALEMGHTNENTIFTNYRQLVKPKEAERYWNIRPMTMWVDA